MPILTRIVTRRCAGAILATLLAGAALLAQGGPVELPKRQNPDPREIGAFYFENPSESQIWINLEPASNEAGANPLLVNATVKFPGTRLERPPATIELRAQVRCYPIVFPERVRQPILILVIDGLKTDLSPDGVLSQFVSTCSGTTRDGRFTLDTVIAQVPFDLLQRMAGARAVGIDAIGFSVHLSPEDLTALRAFDDAVERGVVIKR
jgi:hypothetical protein